MTRPRRTQRTLLAPRRLSRVGWSVTGLAHNGCTGRARSRAPTRPRGRVKVCRMSLTRNRRSPAEVRLAGKSPRRTGAIAAAPDELITVPGDHIVQFYATDDVLIDTLARIVETGLDAGEA